MMSQKKLRVGIVGLGWAGEQHLIAYQRLANVEVVAISEPYAQARERIASKYMIAAAYEDYHDLLGHEDLDIISIATPNYLHSPMAVAALEQGKHVMCEKPIARTAAEAQAMVLAAQAADRTLMVAFNHRQRGDVRLLRAHVETGALGHIYHAKAFWLRRDGIPGMGGWFTSKERAGGGPFIDLGVHMLDMVMHIIGEPKVVSVTAAAYSELGGRGYGSRGDAVKDNAHPMDVEDFATAFLRLEDGSTLTLEASWAMYRELNDHFGVRLYGATGGALLDVVNYTDKDTLTFFADVAGAPATISPKNPESYGHFGVIRDFVEVIRSDNFSQQDGSQGLARTVILEASYRSAALQREVLVSEITAELI